MTPRLARVLRATAVTIAIVGVIDPAMTSMRRTRPEVAVIAANAGDDRLLAARVAEQLEDAFAVIDGPFGGAAATVMVGAALPDAVNDLASPVFAITPARAGPTVTIERVDAPARASLEARSGIAVTTRVTGARGRRLEVSLRRGELAIDRVAVDVGSDDARQRTELQLVPTAAGAMPLRVTAAIGGGGGSSATAATDVAVDVREQRWAVLFFDPRPSWQSTFVRRAVERDPRFVVTSRVVTSRGLSTDAGRPPSSLGDPGALSLFDAIVVGAPDALGEGDVAGLEAFMRRRGGSVVLLLDQRGSGPYQRLTGVREWVVTSASTGFTVIPGGADSAGLRASEIAWPRSLPAGATAIARSRAVGTDSGASHPIIWRSAAGAGQLIVSGALDAWRYRDPARSAFDAFWRFMIADAADAALPPVAVSLGRGMLAPEERTEITVTVREASLATIASNRPARATVGASLETPDGPVPIRLWPDGPIGTFRGSFRAPAAPGSYRVVVTADGSRADAPIIVATAVARPRPDDADLVAAWVASRGGLSLGEGRLAELVPALERAVRPVARRETWYPMRSAWWIVPFALALGAEWLSRRKRGLA